MNRYSLALKKPLIKSKKPRNKKVKKEPKVADPYKRLRKDIENIVEDHSGGIKFVELVTKLVAEKKYARKFDGDTIMSAIHSSDRLEILTYTWRSNNTIKTFVYTP